MVETQSRSNGRIIRLGLTTYNIIAAINGSGDCDTAGAGVALRSEVCPYEDGSTRVALISGDQGTTLALSLGLL